MKTESKADLQIAMIREDVSQPVIDYVMALNPSRLAYRIAKWAYIFASLPGTLFCAIYLADSNDRIANALALARANEMGGLLFRGFFGIAFVTSLFAWLFATTAIFNFIMTRTPRLRASLFVFSLADERASPLMTWSGKRPKNAIALDPSTYLIAATGGRNRNVALAALCFSLFFVAAVQREVRTFVVYTESGYLATPFLPFDRERRGQWRDAARVELGCKHVVGKGSGDWILYDVIFSNGRRAALGNAKAASGEWIDAIEQIDEELRAIGVLFTRSRLQIRRSLDPSCLREHAQKYSPADFDRIERLLRVGEFPSD